MSDESKQQAQIANADRKTVNLDEINTKINRLNRYIGQTDKRIAIHQKELDKNINKMRYEKDFAAKHLDKSATLRREV